MVELAIYSIIVTALLAFKLWWDYRAKNKHNRIINHARSAVIDGVLYLTTAYLSFKDVTLISAVFLITLSYRWIVFDLLFNALNKWPWNHYGSSSKLDLFLAKCGKWHLLIKLIPAIIGVIIYML